MSAHPPSPLELEFARRYDQAHARVCGDERPLGLGRRLSLWRDEWLVRHALKVAGEPGLILDLACGAGRFWPVLGEHGNRVILAADPSQDMLNHAQTHHPAGLLRRVRTFQSSSFSIGLSANAVDCIVCLQLFPHIASSEARLALLDEFHRVSRDSVILAVRIDSRLKGLQDRLLGDHTRQLQPEPWGQTSRARVEAEFKDAGFEVLSHQDFIPGCAAWRVYVLRKQG
ncbi:class I SAM-dependent methyltransferase [Pseudomonas chlororaphis]|uniref:Class I SAM-dependent methyltransferase n=1 Tax=Pseudomonas chlororaphis TaxID=587753 RepID=A0AAP9VX51_9PSED|nr:MULTISPECIES: class I SAM-dependent methyltransferase [Pseudomonas]AUG39698.1 class I SAM-dependent methyltransferase [Pseudomonas chlororaphis]AZE15920.1 SAM-dependent methyltransferase [Pseudomonas chlororaphis subsp. aureofaciens]QNR49292.1 class I SAM-dependent methyltransferase [Pseudomonas chlororaphis]UUT24626.1 class I SAM-dependent methyltransferase [Pseudomonas sp. T8]